ARRVLAGGRAHRPRELRDPGVHRSRHAEVVDHPIEQVARDHAHPATDVTGLLHVIRVGLVVGDAAVRPDLEDLAEAAAREALLHLLHRGREPPAVAALYTPAGP